MQRWIIHIDMDAFFAAVEQRDNPDLRGKPVIIGGTGQRSVVATASYEARRFGVRSAMSMAEARRRCPQGVFLPPDHAKYSSVSKELHAILAQYSPLIEPLSLDEAFLDVSGMELIYASPEQIAAEIKQRIKAELKLTASAGVAANKFLAKLASDMNKPDGLTVILPGQERRVLEHMPIDRLWGVGAATAAAMKRLGINTIGELAAANLKLLQQHFGNSAHELQRLACGLDDRPVVMGQQPKSLGNEVTYEINLTSAETIKGQLLELSEKVGWRLRRAGLTGRTVTVKIRFASFRTITRSRTLSEPTNLDGDIYKTAVELFSAVNVEEGVRLLGITVSNFQAGQLSLFTDTTAKQRAVYAAVDKLKAKFGEDIITRGRTLK